MKGIQDVVGQVGAYFDFDPNDAVGLLKADHRKVDELFKQFEKTRGTASKQKVIDSIIRELTVHASVEEDLVYPLLEASEEEKTSERTKEAEEEHHLLKMALAELANIPASAAEVQPKVKVICELVKHHVHEEETQLLPKLKTLDIDLERLATDIRERKEQLMGGMARGGGVGKNKDVKAKATTSRKSTAQVGKSAAKSRSTTTRSAQAKGRSIKGNKRSGSSTRRRSAA